jgi:transposase
VPAELARGRLRQKLPDLRRALAGRFRRHHAFLAELLGETLERLNAESDERLRPFEPVLARLDTIPGVQSRGGDHSRR